MCSAARWSRPCKRQPASHLCRLSDLAGKGPDGKLRWDGSDGTPRKHVERLWHRALDEPDLYYGYTSEPPFECLGSVRPLDERPPAVGDNQPILGHKLLDRSADRIAAHHVLVSQPQLAR